MIELCTQKEAAAELGLSGAGVALIEQRALEKVRKAFEKRGIDADTAREILGDAARRESVWDRLTAGGR